MLETLWQSTETYISYVDIVDKWAEACVRHSLTDAKRPKLDMVSAAIAINAMFPTNSISKIIKDLSRAVQDIEDRANETAKYWVHG